MPSFKKPYRVETWFERDRSSIVVYDADDRTAEAYGELLRGFTQLALERSGCVAVNLQMLTGNKVAVVRYLNAFLDHLVDVAIWNKGHGAPAVAHNVMNAGFELVLFFSPAKNPPRAIPGAQFQGTVSNVYNGPPQRDREVSELHAATFPIHLPEWVLESFEASGHGIVYDAFLGSGTTLIAAAKLGRRCFGMELSPAYVDVIRKRWTAFARAAGIEPGPGGWDGA